MRRYAYERLTSPERNNTHKRLIDYFDAIPIPRRVDFLEDLATVIELYHHTVKAGKFDEACELYYDRIWKSVYYQFGAYQNQIEMLLSLFPAGENNPPKLKNERSHTWALNELANAYAVNGQPRRAVPLFEMHNVLEGEGGNKKNLAIGLSNVACMAQIQIGALEEAEHNLRRSIGISRDIEDEIQRSYQSP